MLSSDKETLVLLLNSNPSALFCSPERFTIRDPCQSLLLGLVTGVISGVLIWFSVPWFAKFFGLSGQAQGYLIDYMRVGAWLAPFSGILFVASSCLRAYGDTMKPFGAMAVVNVVNVLASLFFIYQLDWGVKGLAMGTVVGWAIGSFLILGFLIPQAKQRLANEEDSPLSLKIENLKYDIPMMRRIWRVSWPSMIEIIGMWSVHAVGVYLIGTMRDGIMGAHALVIRLESISFMPGFAIGMAASTLTGQYLGAKNPEMAKKAIRYCWKVAVISMGTVGLLTAIFNMELLSLFGDVSQEQFQIAAPVVRLVGCVQVLTATMMVMKMSMRGAGDTRTVTVYSFASMGLIRVAFLWGMMKWVGLDLMGIWFVLSVDALVQASIFTRLHFRGKWAEKEV